jgi:hypothetical protein
VLDTTVRFRCRKRDDTKPLTSFFDLWDLASKVKVGTERSNLVPQGVDKAPAYKADVARAKDEGTGILNHRRRSFEHVGSRRWLLD